MEVRVLGCLIEKQRTTPDIYPLTLNALRAACNQSTNRDPVVAYDEAMIREALQRLGRRGLTRLAGASRAAKFRHLLDDTLRLPAAEQAVLAVLALRGPQTPGELRQRTERLYRFADAAAAAGGARRARGAGARGAPRADAGAEGGALHAPPVRRCGRGARGAGGRPRRGAGRGAPAGAAARPRRPPPAWRTTTGWSGWSAGSRRWRPSCADLRAQLGG